MENADAMKISLFLLCLSFTFISVSGSIQSLYGEDSASLDSESFRSSPSYIGSITLDILLPGYGFYRAGHPYMAGLMAGGRILSAVSAVNYKNRYYNYRSLSRAAAIAELYYGPGISLYDPYRKSYRKKDSLKREMGQMDFYYGLSLTVHAILTAVSLYYSDDYAYNEYLKTRPEFQLPESTTNDAIANLLNSIETPHPLPAYKSVTTDQLIRLELTRLDF